MCSNPCMLRGLFHRAQHRTRGHPSTTRYSLPKYLFIFRIQQEGRFVFFFLKTENKSLF